MSWGVATQNGVSVSLASIVSLSAGVTEFSPIDLFTAGTVGAWYDPSDYSTLFQDSAGTTPVTAVEQPVGLMLDKSQGLVLGSELVTNGGPDFTSTTGWTGYSTSGAAATLSIVSGWLRVTPNGTSGGWGSATVTYPASWIAVTVQWRTSGGASAARVTTFFPGLDTDLNGTSGTQTFYLAKTGGSGELRLHCKDITGWVEYRVISVKALPGNHASQATSTSRPVLRARYNQLTYSEQFDNAAWTKTNVTLTANAIAAPDGTLTADNAAISAATAVTSVNSNAGVTVSVGTLTVSCYVKANGVQYANVGFIYSAGIYSGTQFDLTNGTVVRTASNTYTSPSATITPLSNGWYRCTHTVTVTTTTIYPFVSPSNALWTTGEPRQSLTGNGTDGIYVWGADLRTGSSAGTYQRIAAATDYATAGFLPYLYFVTDDSFGTNSINFTSTDKMAVVAGVTKLGTAASILAELSANIALNAGSFYIGPNVDGSNSYTFALQGTAGCSYAATAYSAPITNTISAQYDIAGAGIANEIVPKVNGATPTLVATGANAGTGNFGNYPLYIGRRNNATLPFEGRIYGLIVAGKTLSASELSATEAWMNSKTGAY